MAEQLDRNILPLLPLTSGVVLPGMVVTLTLETEDARGAAEAARSHDGHLLLVPRVGSRYATVGTVAQIEDIGRLPNGMEALIIRGLHRTVVGTGVAGTGDATCPRARPRVPCHRREHRGVPRRPAGRRVPPGHRRARRARRHGRLLARPHHRAEGPDPRAAGRGEAPRDRP